MFNARSITFPPVGKLHSQGQRKTWEGQWLLREFSIETPFAVLIYGERDAPLPAQQQALEQMLACLPEWKNAATAAILALLQEAQADELIPANVALRAENLWMHLTPAQLEVSDYSHYGNGRDLLISLGFITPWNEDSGIQIHLKNGDTFDGLGTE